MCPEALAALAIDSIADPHPTGDLPIPLGIMQEHYQTAIKAWLVAKRLGRSTLEQSSKFLLELITFAAFYKHQKRPRFIVRGDDVLQTMARHIANIKTWCLSIGDSKYTPTLELLEDAIRAATSSDEVVLSLFGFGDTPEMTLDDIKRPPGKKHA